MNKIKNGLLLIFVLSLFCSACSKKIENPRLVINEVLVVNETNAVDEYGERGAWIEIFNNTAATLDLRGCFLTDEKSNLAKYKIPNGDVETVIPPYQHVLFWADGKPGHGTFHVNFELDPNKESYIALVDANGKTIIDEVIIPAGQLKDISWGYEIDGKKFDKSHKDQIKVLSRVTPSTNNFTLDTNPKVELMKKEDKYGIIMSFIAMSVVFTGLFFLYRIFKQIGKIAVNMGKKRAEKAKEEGSIKTSTFAAEDIPSDVIAAISMALYDAQHQDIYDIESAILTMTKVNKPYSPWSSKEYGFRQTPLKRK